MADSDAMKILLGETSGDKSATSESRPSRAQALAQDTLSAIDAKDLDMLARVYKSFLAMADVDEDEG